MISIFLLYQNRDNHRRYRNKVQLPIGKVNGKIAVGFYSPRSHDIVDIDECLIQGKIADNVARLTKQWIIKNNIEPAIIDGGYNPNGIVKHIMIRKAFKTNEVMVVLVATTSEIPNIDKFIKRITENIEGIKSIILNINPQETNVILGEKCITLYGSDTIQDYIGEFKFNISPLSFFQINPRQTEVLYGKALEYAGITGDQVVFDAYCGRSTKKRLRY